MLRNEDMPSFGAAATRITASSKREKEIDEAAVIARIIAAGVKDSNAIVALLPLPPVPKEEEPADNALAYSNDGKRISLRLTDSIKDVAKSLGFTHRENDNVAFKKEQNIAKGKQILDSIKIAAQSFGLRKKNDAFFDNAGKIIVTLIDKLGISSLDRIAAIVPATHETMVHIGNGKSSKIPRATTQNVIVFLDNGSRQLLSLPRPLETVAQSHDLAYLEKDRTVLHRHGSNLRYEPRVVAGKTVTYVTMRGNGAIRLSNSQLEDMEKAGCAFDVFKAWPVVEPELKNKSKPEAGRPGTVRTVPIGATAAAPAPGQTA